MQCARSSSKWQVRVSTEQTEGLLQTMRNL
jgi:hypothetical protein